MSDLLHALRKCICDNGTTREVGGNPMSGGYQCEKCRVRRQAADKIEHLESELAKLRKAIQDAPHAKNCYSLQFHPYESARYTACDCWKSNALEEK